MALRRPIRRCLVKGCDSEANYFPATYFVKEDGIKLKLEVTACEEHVDVVWAVCKDLETKLDLAIDELFKLYKDNKVEP